MLAIYSKVPYMSTTSAG